MLCIIQCISSYEAFTDSTDHLCQWDWQKLNHTTKQTKNELPKSSQPRHCRTLLKNKPQYRLLSTNYKQKLVYYLRTTLTHRQPLLAPYKQLLLNRKQSHIVYYSSCIPVATVTLPSCHMGKQRALSIKLVISSKSISIEKDFWNVTLTYDRTNVKSSAPIISLNVDICSWFYQQPGNFRKSEKGQKNVKQSRRSEIKRNLLENICLEH